MGGGQFGQNGQKLHEIKQHFGGTIVGVPGAGKLVFRLVGGSIPPFPPPLGELLHRFTEKLSARKTRRDSSDLFTKYHFVLVISI